MRHSRFVPLLACTLIAGCSKPTTPVPDRLDSATFNFVTNGFTFRNFDNTVGGGDLTPALTARMFGNAATCKSGSQGTCVPTDIARSWITEVNTQLAFGHSEGMAVLSLLMSLAKVDPKTFGGANAAALPVENRALREELAYWAATQKVLGVHDDDKNLKPSEAISFLADALTRSDEGWRLLIAVRDENGFRAGHAVVPFGYFKGEADGQYFLRLYDPSYPNEERRLELNTKTELWSYEGSPNVDNPRTYVGNPDNGNLLYFSPVTKRMGMLVPPFSDGFSASSTDGTLLVEGDGTSVGLKNGAIVEVGGKLLPGAADCFCKAPTGITNVMVKSNGAQTISVGGDAGTVFATSPSLAATVSGQGTGGMTVDPSKKTVTLNSTSDAGTTLTTTTKNSNGSQTTVTVVVDKASAGVTIDTSDPNNVRVTADVSPAATNIYVTTTVTRPDGTSETTVSQATTTGGNDAVINVNTADGGTTVNTAVNYAVCKNNNKDPMESDKDCGAFCGMQPERYGNGLCSVGATCGVSADCDPPPNSLAGECVMGKCSAQTCTDGRKNQKETSVDCGNGCPCPAGFACATAAECRAGTDCFGSLCRAVQSVNLTIVGLPGDAYVRLFNTHDGHGEVFTDVSGSASGANIVKQYSAIDSMKLRFTTDTRVRCDFDNHDANGDWVWAVGTMATLPPNTLRCSRVRIDVSYTTNGTGCPAETIRESPAWVTVRELMPSGPVLSISATHPAVQLLPLANSVLINRSTSPTLWQGLVLRGDAGLYDGGNAYSFSLGAPVEAQGTLSYSRANPGDIAALNIQPRTWRYSCTQTGATTGPIGNTALVASLTCSCVELVDGGVVVTDAGSADAGSVDSGTVVVDAGPATCTTDSECGTSADCYCGASSGACSGRSGVCGAAKFSTSTPTADGIAASGAFTIPLRCFSVRVEAWGAAGGPGTSFGPPSSQGGAGGFVSGNINVLPGEVITTWVGHAGDIVTNHTTNEGQGSYLGAPATGGFGQGALNMPAAGSGGGLTSIQHTQGATVLDAIVVPGGGGAGSTQPANAAGASPSGGSPTRSGLNAALNSASGGGGAGEDGGVAGTSGRPGAGGTFGPLPSGLTTGVGNSSGAPAGTTLPDYNSFCSSAGQAQTFMPSGNGCVVIRCVP